MPNRVPQELTANSILQERVGSCTYACVSLDRMREQVPQTVSLNFEGEHQDVEWLKIANDARGHFVFAAKPVAEGGLGKLAETGSLTGLVIRDWRFEEDDQVKFIEKFPAVDFDQVTLLSVGPSDYEGSLALLAVVAAGSGFFVLSWLSLVIGTRFCLLKRGDVNSRILNRSGLRTSRDLKPPVGIAQKPVGFCAC